MKFIKLTLAFPAKDTIPAIDVNPEKICRLIRVVSAKETYTHVGYGVMASHTVEMADMVLEDPEIIKGLINA